MEYSFLIITFPQINLSINYDLIELILILLNYILTLYSTKLYRQLNFNSYQLSILIGLYNISMKRN
jgi:hypothetical protein